METLGRNPKKSPKSQTLNPGYLWAQLPQLQPPPRGDPQPPQAGGNGNLNGSRVQGLGFGSFGFWVLA